MPKHHRVLGVAFRLVICHRHRRFNMRGPLLGVPIEGIVKYLGVNGEPHAWKPILTHKGLGFRATMNPTLL